MGMKKKIAHLMGKKTKKEKIAERIAIGTGIYCATAMTIAAIDGADPISTIAAPVTIPVVAVKGITGQLD